MKWGERVAEQNMIVHPLISINFLTLVPYASLNLLSSTNPWASSNMMAPSFPELAMPCSQLIQTGEQKDSIEMVTTCSVGLGLACSHFLHERPISIILLFMSPCKTW